MDATESPGRRIATLRKSNGWRQQDLADKANVSKSMVAKVESGHVPPSTAFLGSVARALDVDMAFLVGEPAELRDDASVAMRRAISSIRRALASYDLVDGEDDVSPASVDSLRAEVAQVNAWRRDTAYAKIGAVLPSLLERLIIASETAESDHDRERVYAMLADCYRAANTLAHKLSQMDLSLTAVDRMEWAASRSGDPLLMATTHYLRAAALARIGEGRRALRLLTRTMTALEGDIGNDQRALAVYGSLHMKAGTIAATLADAGAASTHLDEAARAADNTGADAVYYETTFGPTNVALHKLSAAIDLGNPVEAVRLAQTTRVPDTMATERRAYGHIDGARAYLLNQEPDKAIEELYEAFATSPLHFRGSSVVKAAIRAIAEQQRRSSSGVRALAARAGISD